MNLSNTMVINSTQMSFTNDIAYGAWFELWRYTNWSLHVMNLEADGSIDVYISNEGQKPAPNVADANAVLLTSITTSELNAFFQGGGTTATWIMLAKNQGAAPNATVVNLCGQIP